MQVHYSLDNLNISNSVVTVGSFDGVHFGHAVIINRINELARKMGGQSVVFTFYPHPRKVLYPDSKGKDLKMITTIEEKIPLLEKLGLDHLVVAPFTHSFSELTSTEFVRQILVQKLNAVCVVVGFNHFFGHNRTGDFSLLHLLGDELNFKVEEIPEQDVQNETVSSTTIRKSLERGRIGRVNAYLDHYYFVFSVIDNAEVPTGWFCESRASFCIDDDDKLLPPFGAYAVTVFYNNLEYKAMAWHNIKNENQFFLEFIDEVSVTEGESISVVFHKKLFVSDSEYNGTFIKDLKKSYQVVSELIY
ncbi:MAG: hypothetical protein N4A72_18510 [Bacteroidales bacterium]|jgi:riboflavin kinase/FMN adenylyltransferase|nr:hypothetical protein [Bacteroidales bacterium]